MIQGAILAAGLILSQPVVIDGDTLRDGQARYRVENIDAPERGRRALCPHEAAMAEAARDQVRIWIYQAERVEAFPSGEDRYRRTLARIEIDGADLGERLIARGLAKPWEGRKSDFCTAPLD